MHSPRRVRAAASGHPAWRYSGGFRVWTAPPEGQWAKATRNGDLDITRFQSNIRVTPPRRRHAVMVKEIRKANPRGLLTMEPTLA